MHAVIDIALGIIFNEQQQLLIALRTKDSDQGNLWELPGGKVEAEESVEAALVREMHEELAIIVKRVQPIMSVAHRHHNRTVRLQTFHIIDYQGRIIGAEGQLLRSLRAMESRRLRPVVRSRRRFLADRFAGCIIRY